jgi:hypothetical protein
MKDFNGGWVDVPDASFTAETAKLMQWGDVPVTVRMNVASWDQNVHYAL